MATPYDAEELATMQSQHQQLLGSTVEYHQIPLASNATGTLHAANDLEEQDKAVEQLKIEYKNYETSLEGIVHNILNGTLREGSQVLLQKSEWLLSHVKELGEDN